MALMKSSQGTCIGCGVDYNSWNEGVPLCPECEQFLIDFNSFYLYYFLEQEDLIARVRELERSHGGYHRRIRLNTNRHINSCIKQKNKQDIEFVEGIAKRFNMNP